MNVTRENKKAEAIKRMRVLNLFEPCIRAFEKRDEVQLSEPTGGLYEFSGDEWLTNFVKEFEEEHNALVYHVIHTFTDFGEIYNVLFVSDYPEEYEYDNADIKDGYVFVWAYNKSDPMMSDMGTIGVKWRFGGLVRVC